MEKTMYSKPLPLHGVCPENWHKMCKLNNSQAYHIYVDMRKSMKLKAEKDNPDKFKSAFKNNGYMIVASNKTTYALYYKDFSFWLIMTPTKALGRIRSNTPYPRNLIIKRTQPKVTEDGYVVIGDEIIL